MVCFSIKLEQQSGLIFFSECTLSEYYVKYLVNLVDSLDHGYGKMPKLLEQYE